MPGLPGGRRQPARQATKPKGRGKGVSGNPAKRAAGPEALPAAQLQPEWNPADAFGLGKAGQPSEAELAKTLGDFQLPPDLQKMFNQKNQGPR
jgi:signal recognition particle subunit SRP54